MVSQEKLKDIQKKALAAVADMPEGDLKTKAFEVFLQHLLSSETSISQSKTSPPDKNIEKAKKSSRQPGTVKSRILLLKDEKFFETPKTMGDVKDELHAHGWIHPNTALSGALQGLVRERHLRRIKEKVWKYVNP